MTMEDNSEFGGSYGSFLMYGSSPTPNAKAQPEADNANTAQPQASNMATVPAVEADQTREPALETEAAAAVVNSDSQNVDVDDLNKQISAKERKIRREQEELEKLEETHHQLLQEKQHHPPEQWQQQQLRLAQRNIMNKMSSLMDRGIIDGFVYGLVPKGNDPVSAASENLSGWWRNEAQFDRDGPIAISRYQPPSSQINENINHNSLMEIQNNTLESLASALMQHCDPPQRCYPFDKGVAPPWWPTGNEEWWGQMTLPEDMSVPPYKKPHGLKKWWKVTVLVAMVKHLITDNHSLIIRAVRESKSLQKQMSAKDNMIWSAYIENERNNLNQSAPLLVHGLNAQQIPCGGGGSTNEEASLPAFLLHQPAPLLAQETTGNELYNIKGKAVIPDDTTLYRRRPETGLYINDTPMMEGQVIPDNQIGHTNHNPLSVADYGVESFSNEVTGCSTDWHSSDKMDLQPNTDDI